MKKIILLILTLLILLPLEAQDYYRVRKQNRISTGMDEAGAVPFEDGAIVYITESTSVGASSPRDAENRRLFTIFQYREGGTKKPFDEALVTTRHEGPVSFTADFNTMVFCQQRPAAGNRDYDPLGLYFAERVDGRWTNIRPFDHNDSHAWLFSPCLDRGGRTLYFSANYPGGQGGFDIYRSEKRGDTWTEPENLGPAVNTSGNELYPFIHHTGRLCFSSDGHDNNVGGFDLFETRKVEGKWRPAMKMPAPFSTLSDDYQAWFSEDLKSGFITSDRQGGSKDIFTFAADLPSFESPAAIKKTYYKYRIYDRKLDSIDTDLFRYSWLINDTLEIPGHDIIYRFPGPGTYVCALQIFDLELDTLLEGQTVQTLRIALHEQAVITVPRDTILMGEPVTFSAGDTYLPGFDIGRYVWNFGDGRFGQGEEVEHRFSYPGKFRVLLTVEERKRNRRHEPGVHTCYKEIIVLEP